MRQQIITVFYLVSALLIVAILAAQWQRQQAASAATTPQLRFVHTASPTPKERPQNDTMKRTVSEFIDSESELLEYYQQGRQ
ncbi:hypothetical protein SAMN04488540_103310 [Ferrimonas sediminum]|uniref:Uncharacterized protein n=1 Tax=Ferrimonas sediminum TaxID=718193 RepID=A0A1G8P253_9GAMM|nr:hypothetical protein [Ferrimonas sediminum]SDI86549.1 hypothetical protein SAMN04488540_103310 [Ferrimonas sediminum]